MRRVAPDVLLRTERLTLRRFTPADADALRALDSDPEVVRYTNAGLTGGGPPSRVDAVRKLESFIARYADGAALAFWAAEDRATGGFLGWFQFTPADTPGEAELGFRLVRAAWGQGLATEGARALVETGFRDLGVTRIVSSALVANAASIRVMENAGLRLAREFTHDPGGPSVEYALTRKEFEAASAP